MTICPNTFPYCVCEEHMWWYFLAYFKHFNIRGLYFEEYDTDNWFENVNRTNYSFLKNRELVFSEDVLFNGFQKIDTGLKLLACKRCMENLTTNKFEITHNKCSFCDEGLYCCSDCNQLSLTHTQAIKNIQICTNCKEGKFEIINY